MDRTHHRAPGSAISGTISDTIAEQGASESTVPPAALREAVLAEGFRLMAFSAADASALRIYLATPFQLPTWLQQVRCRQPVPASLLQQARHVPLRLAAALSTPPQGTRDVYLDGCVMRLVVDSWVLVDVLTPERWRPIA
ncbi:hypothetical protein K8B33_05820 [Alcanivorax sp. JB21]|uniref:hypothetical protein n=1 Tax=Alcanivorax limicola TaxID=2874102 RepID=UPI001CC10C1B|nr:hypothetical protein [Alcanivorax limicola]MBZ2188602.1 hypothetical protein [Alcanivorax limicola]